MKLKEVLQKKNSKTSICKILSGEDQQEHNEKYNVEENDNVD
jgi:hypothetical protein